MSVKLIFVHGEGQPVHQSLDIVVDKWCDLTLTDAARSFLKCRLVDGEELVSCVHIAEAEHIAVHQLQAVPLLSLVV